VTVAAGDLAFFFPEGEGGLLARLGAPAVVAVLFILAAASCLYIILRTAAGHKRYTAAMEDFVTNMTHEFKTPISTIALVSEALDQPPVRADEKRQAKYRTMISSECRRMQDQIRKILETAALEKGDLDLNISRMDAHEAIREAAEAFLLAVENRGGSLITRFEAEEAVVEADSLHFQNVIRNLIDNAVQYSVRRRRSSSQRRRPERNSGFRCRTTASASLRRRGNASSISITASRPAMSMMSRASGSA